MLAVHAAARDTVCCRRRRSRAVASIPDRPAKERGMSSQRLLIRNGFVVSMDYAVGDVPSGDVLVEDGKIAEIGRGLDVSEAEEIDATGMIVMPGFVDTHRHTWQTPVRGVLPCCTLDHYFAVMLGSVGGHYRPDDGLITLALAARAPGNCNFEVAKHDWELARDLGIRISVHVGMRLTNVHVHHVKNMADLGLMGPDTTYIHCTDSTDEELDLIKETGGTASVAPYVEMLMGHGRPPTGKLLQRGVPVSLSVDVVSSVPGEMFTQMRTALVHERIGAFTETPDEAFAPTLTHRDVLEFATIEGARACALEDRVGSLAPGKQADIVLLKVNAINTAPMVDPVGTIVVFADTSNVDSVFVAGRALKRNGELVGADLEDVFRKLDESRNHILSRGELLPEWAAEPVAAA